MKFTVRCARLSLLACCWAVPAHAADLSADVGLVSDYRYRGISLSGHKPALQGSIGVELERGAYGSVWASTIDEPDFDANVEVDLTAGYSVAAAADLVLDLSATYYVYPSEQASNYFEATAAIERSSGPGTVRAGFSFVPKQRSTRDDDDRKRNNSYLFVGADYDLSKLPISLSGQVGGEWGYFSEAGGGAKLDWSLGGALALGKVRVGLTYSGSDAARDAVVASLFVTL